MRTWMMIAGMIVVLAGLSACNTVEGVGKDMKSAGNAVAGAAEKHK